MSKILLVEDSPGDMLLARKAVKQLSSEVSLLIAATGKDALRQVEAYGPDLVLLDLNLPDISGFEVLTYMQSQYPDISVFVLSTSRNPKDIERASELGVSGYQSKPRSYQDYAAFIAQLGEFLDSRPPRRVVG
ncbi:MAG: response regulator [Pseudomonadales bacterium]